MFKCNKCKRITEPGEKLNKMVTKIRERNYVNKILNKYGKEVEKESTGYEIVKEINVCDKCYDEEEDLVWQMKSNLKI